MRKASQYRMKVLLAALFLIFNHHAIEAQDKFSFTINKKAVGVILNKKTNKPIGSAFWAGSQKKIFTCAHVATKGDFAYKGVSLAKGIDLTLNYYLPKYDLSVFVLAESIDGEPLKFGDIKRIRPGDPIVYIGWDKDILKMKVNKTNVSSVGSGFNSGVIIDFIEFQGEGLPGYSGGPVFDTKGNVIAIMREGWTKQGVRGGKAVLMNRAFSIEIITILDSEVYSIKVPNREASTGAGGLEHSNAIEKD